MLSQQKFVSDVTGHSTTLTPWKFGTVYQWNLTSPGSIPNCNRG